MQSNSELKIARECARRHNWRYGQRLAPRVRRAGAAELGTDVHTHLEAYYGRDVRPAPSDEDDRAGIIAERYVTRAEEDGLDIEWQVEGVEVTRHDEQLDIKGIADMLVSVSGELMLVDHKTTGRALSVFASEVLRATQGVHYAILFPEVSGIIYNIISTKSDSAEILRVTRRIGASERAAYVLHLGQWRDALAAAPEVPSPGDACMYCELRAPCAARDRGEDYQVILDTDFVATNPDARYEERPNV